MKTEMNKKPWYKEWWGILLIVLFFPILVPFLVWTKTNWNKGIKISITIICAIFFIAAMVESNKNQEKALKLAKSAESYVQNGDIDKALTSIEKSKELYSDQEKNPVFKLEKKIKKMQSLSVKKTLTKMSDEDFELLTSGKLKTKFVDHKALNTIFIEKLKTNAEKRATYLAKIEKEKQIESQKKAEKDAKAAAEKAEKEAKAAQEKTEKEAKAAVEKRKELIEEQFSLWDGSHKNLTKVIKDSMNNPDSYEHVETKYWDMGEHLIVSTTFRGTNAFGAVVKNTVKAKVSLEGEVLEILEQY